MDAKQRKEWRKKCKEYAKILKDDFDFDWIYILRILCYKLKRTRECIAKGHLLHRKERAQEILAVEKLLNRVLKFDYESEVLKPYYKKYGKGKLHHKPWPDDENEYGYSELEILYKGKPATKAMSKEFIRLLNVAWKNKKADLKKAMDLMAEQLFGWWD